MSHKQNNSTFLYWSLVGGCFFLIILFWIPSFLEEIHSLKTTVSEQKNESAAYWKNEWAKSQVFLNQTTNKAPAPQKEQGTPLVNRNSDAQKTQQDTQKDQIPQSNDSLPLFDKQKNEEKQDPLVAYCLEKGGVVRKEKMQGKNSDVSFCDVPQKKSCELKTFFDGLCEK